MLTLNQIAVGKSAKVTQLPDAPALRKQLLSMGFTPNVTINVIRQAPLGDPIEYGLRGYSVSLRLVEAKLIGVEAITTAQVGKK